MSRPKGSKNKPKVPETDRLEQLLDWGPKIEAFCENKGFSPYELIEKFEGLEKRIGEMIANSSSLTFSQELTPHEVLEKYGPEAYEIVLDHIKGQNKPDPAPETEKRIQDTPEFKKGQEKAKNEGETKPKELSPFLKSRQNSKNGMK